MRAVIAALAAALVAATAVASCGGAAAKRTAEEPTLVEPRALPADAPPEVVRARIETLDREIAARGDSLAARAPTPMIEPGTSGTSGSDGGPSTSPMTSHSGAEPKACVRSARPVCQDVCSLSDSICDAADEICQLAGALPGDAWAAGRCTAGKDSCARARTRCCGC